MPELPDVERFKRILDETALGETVACVTVTAPRLLGNLSPAAFSARLQGRRLVSSRRHGKHLLVGLDDGGWLTFHFGMTGGLAPFEDPAEDPPYDRVRFDFASGRRLAYTNVRLLGRLGLAEDPDRFLAAEGLGPDALDPAVDLEAFVARVLRGRRAVKAALMDQSALAGIGNIYADEILFQARLHPARRTDGLTPEEAEVLNRTLRRVLETAIARGTGSETFLDRLPADYLLPRREKGGHCPRCGTALETAKVGGRTGYLCPRCQPAA